MAARITKDSNRTTVKAGVHTTEFWTSLFAAGYMVANATDVLNQIPPSWSAVGIAVITAAYNLSRGRAKSGN